MVDVSTNQLLREMFQSQLPKTERKISINKRVSMTPRNSVRVREFRFPDIYHATTHVCKWKQHNFHLKESSRPPLQLDLRFPESSVSLMIFSISQGPADNAKQVPTLSGQFRQSLDSLMKALSDCQPFFVRCIKPNDKRQPKVNDAAQRPQHHNLPPELVWRTLNNWQVQNGSILLNFHFYSAVSEIEKFSFFSFMLSSDLSALL